MVAAQTPRVGLDAVKPSTLLIRRRPLSIFMKLSVVMRPGRHMRPLDTHVARPFFTNDRRVGLSLNSGTPRGETAAQVTLA